MYIQWIIPYKNGDNRIEYSNVTLDELKDIPNVSSVTPENEPNWFTVRALVKASFLDLYQSMNFNKVDNPHIKSIEMVADRWKIDIIGADVNHVRRLMDDGYLVYKVIWNRENQSCVTVSKEVTPDESYYDIISRTLRRETQ